MDWRGYYRGRQCHGHNSYHVREKATRWLWEHGVAARAALEGAEAAVGTASGMAATATILELVDLRCFFGSVKPAELHHQVLQVGRGDPRDSGCLTNHRPSP